MCMCIVQGKAKEALAVISGPQGSVATMAAERSHLQAVLLMMSGDEGGAAALLAGQLRENPDDWSSLQLYCECVMGRRPTPPADLGAEAGSDAARKWLGERWPESSLLRLSGGLMAELSPPQLHPAEVKTWTRAELESGHEAAVDLVRSMTEIVESTPDAGSAVQKLTMRGPYLASVRSLCPACQM